MTNQALNSYAIGVVVTGEPQLTKLGNTLRTVGGQVDDINRKLAGGKGASGADKNATQTEKSHKKVMTSSEKRKKSIERDQKAERASMSRTNSRVRAQSQRFEKYNRKIQFSSRLTKNEITDMFRRVALWSTGIGVLFGTLSKIKFIFGAVKDLEVQMAELKKVMDDDTPFKTAQNALFQTALSMSVSVDKAAEIAKTWAQQGYELKEVAALTKTALLGVNAANLTAGQSVEFLTSAIKSFKVEAEETTGVIDSIMAIQADFAITSANLAKGLQVAGAITAQLGGDMNELFGMMTAVGEITRETGNVIGNSLKTQLARMQQPRTIAYLERLGIATRRLTDEGAIKRLSAYDIFKQISEKRQAGVLTQDQVLDISLKIGGIRKFKDALILIENFDTAMEAMQTGFLAYGDAADASAIIQDTLARKMDKLNTAFVELGAIIGELGNLQGFKWIVDSITSLVTGLSSMAKGEGVLGAAGSAAFHAIPIALLGGFAKFLGKRVFQNIRGTELRSVQEMANLGAGPLSRTQRQSRYTFFGKGMVDPRFAKAWGTEIKNISLEAKKAGINFGSAHKQLAFMSTMSKTANSGIGGLNKNLKGLKARAFLAGRALRSTFAPGTIPGGKPMMGGQVSGGLATARIFSSLGGLLKGLAGTGAILLAIEGLTSLFQYVKSIQPKTIDFKNMIDVTSEASKAFVDLSKEMEIFVKRADEAGKKVGEFVKDLSFVEKQQEVQLRAEAVGKIIAFSMFAGLEKAVPEFEKEAFLKFAKTAKIGKFAKPFTVQELGETEEKLRAFYKQIITYLSDNKNIIVKDRSDLKKVLDDFGFKDLKTEEATKSIQKAFRDGLKFGVGGDFQQLTLETNKNLSVATDEFIKGLKDAKIAFGGITTVVEGSLDQWREVGIRATTGGFLEPLGIGAPEVSKFLIGFSRGFIQNSKEIGEAFKEAKKDIKGLSIQEVFDIKEGDLVTASINKIVKIWDGIAVESDKLPKLSEILGPTYFDAKLGTFSGDPLARANLPGGLPKEESSRIAFEEAVRNYTTIARDRINDFKGAVKSQDMELFRAMGALGQDIPNSLNVFSESTLGIGLALQKIPDPIFKAVSSFVSKMEKIEIKDSLSGILGVGTQPEKESLSAVRQFITSTSQLASGIADARRVQENINERLTTVFGELSNKVSRSLINIIDGVTNKTKKLADAMLDIDLLEDDPSLKDIKGGKQTVTTARGIIRKLFEIRKKEGLIAPELSGAIDSWNDLLDNLRTTTSVVIPGEVEMKRIFDEARKGNTTLLDKFFESLMNQFINRSAKALTKIGLDKLNTKFEQQVSKLSSYANRFYKTGVDITDAQLKAVIDTQQRLQGLNIEAAGVRRQLSDPGIQGQPREHLLSRLQLIEAEKKGISEISALTSSLELMAIEADKITDATDTARQAFTQFFADVKQFDPNTNAASFAIEDALNQIANVRLENISEKFTNQLLAGFDKLSGMQFGEFLLGEDLKDPLDLNTNALGDLTMSVDELRAAIKMMPGLGMGEEMFGGLDGVIPKITEPITSGNFGMDLPYKTVEEFLNRPMTDFLSDTGTEEGFGLKVPTYPMDEGGFGMRIPTLEFDPAESFYGKPEKIEKAMEELSEIFESGGKKIEFEIDDLLSGAGQVLGGYLGGIVAKGAGKETGAVNIGTALGGAVGQMKFMTSAFGSFAGPIGSIVGGMIGGLAGRDKEIEEEKIDNLKKIADNTAQLVDIDSRIINAPADFILPSTSLQGGAMNWSGNIIINGATSPTDTANEVVKAIDRTMSKSTSNYNTVTDRLT